MSLQTGPTDSARHNSTIDVSQVSARVEAVVAQAFSLPPNEVTPDTSMGNPPAWDSFGHMQLVAAIEQEFGIAFPSYKLSELSSVQAISAAVAELLTA